MQYLDQIIQAQHQHLAHGITSICSAHPEVLENALRRAVPSPHPVLIEATCNQVNQYGGYTGMTPVDFVRFVEEIAARTGFPRQRLRLGGDHLGPSAWQDEPASPAMEKAKILMRDYVRAGFTKIHVDASMKLGDDPPEGALDPELSARRSAELVAAAEEAASAFGRNALLRYVIGTEVPVPGGSRDDDHGLQVSTPEDTAETLAQTRRSFEARGLQEAWERVCAIVVQPGVEFGDQSLHVYDRQRAGPLSRFIESQPGLVYEAHSTDYQARQALRQLVEDHFAILKVGPALTFAYREAIVALAMIENELYQGSKTPPSGLLDALESAMLANPRYWEKYYHGDPVAQRIARLYSLSDRVRYYWPNPTVQSSLHRLFANMARQPLPLTMVSQYLPVQYQRVRQGLLSPHPRDLIADKINLVLEDYEFACGL
jgi:D-tagatose-1,6-bisphosphate aldolase subunit GatZ/KbaZ